MKRWRAQWGYKDADNKWQNDVAGCSYTVTAPNERAARKQVRDLLKRRTFNTTRIAYIYELSESESTPAPPPPRQQRK